MNNFASIFEELSKLYDEDPVEEACTNEALEEEAEDDVIEIEDDAEASEAAEDIVDEDDEPRQVIIECDGCGALVIKDEADIVADEESGLVNVEDACAFCEEAAGYKIVGVVAPYDPDDADVVTEDLGDWYRKKFDKPASTATQQRWEDELNDDSISPERRKNLEKKFQQQRDWEARHPDKDPVAEYRQ
jgi:hypothetical protein